MTDFTGNIETTAESLEALQGDLETHPEGIFGVDIDVEAPTLASGGDGLPHILDVWVAFPGAKEQIEDRLGVDRVERCEMKVKLHVGDGE